MDIISGRNFIDQVEIACVIFGYKERQLKILVSKINFKGNFYDLPTGYILQDENIEVAAQRIIEERTNLSEFYLEQFKVFGKADWGHKKFIDEIIELNFNDSTTDVKNLPVYHWYTKRFISIGYYALVNLQEVIPRLTEIDESMNWYNIHELPEIIKDGNLICAEALKCLREDIELKFNAFNLLPETFTMKEIQEIYETIFEKEYIRTNFQKKILEMNVLERLDKKYTGAKNKAPYLYKLK